MTTALSLTRRSLLNALAAAGVVSLVPASRAAADIDSLKLFIPAAPGGGWDQTGRAIEQVVRSAGLVKSVQFTHAPGAGGAVGLPKFVSTAKGHGDNMMVAGMVMVGALIANKSPVDLSQTTPIARLTGEFLVVVVPTASPHKSIGDLVAALKANPGGVSWAGGSAGGSDHILVGMIAQASGVDPRATSYVAYAGGGPAQAALLGNKVTAGVSGWGEFAEQVKAGNLRALALSADKRIDGIDVPTLREQGIPVELFNWRGVFAGSGLSPADYQGLLELVDKMVKTSAWKEELKNRDWTDTYLAGEAFANFLKTHTKDIETVLKALGLAA